VTNINNSAFYNCTGLTGSLVIPSSVTFIGNLAFHGCSFSSVTIPTSVATIEINVFENCASLTNVNCRVTRSIMNATDCLLGSGVTTLHALASDGTWTAGADTIGGQALTVIKDLT